MKQQKRYDPLKAMKVLSNTLVEVVDTKPGVHPAGDLYIKEVRGALTLETGVDFSSAARLLGKLLQDYLDCRLLEFTISLAPPNRVILIATKVGELK